ncbi:MAG: class I SAM-dependent methyltransferase [Candidatus Colwellbacteria bacterium]|nr:class I SAM-dependent methyltransferase [Candidatus Colwellbacteria bacterium]
MDFKEELWGEIRPTGRSAEECFEDLGISLEFLKGKKILDIGSGLNQFAQDLKQEHLDLTSIDMFYALTPEERKKVFSELSPENFETVKTSLDRMAIKDKDSHLVGGRAESLPFLDETFDVVLAEYSMPHYAENRESMRDFFFEVARVLKPGGEAHIYPMRIRPGRNVTRKDAEEVLSNLRNLGFSVEVSGKELGDDPPDTRPLLLVLGKPQIPPDRGGQPS